MDLKVVGGVFTGKRRLYEAVNLHPESMLARLVALIEQGAVTNQVEAAAKLGVTSQRVQRLVKEYDLGLRRPRVYQRLVCEHCGRAFRRRLDSTDTSTTCSKCRRAPLLLTCPGCRTTRSLRKSLYEKKTDLCGPCWQHGLGENVKYLQGFRLPKRGPFTLAAPLAEGAPDEGSAGPEKRYDPLLRSAGLSR